MKILGIDSSGLTASVALTENNILLAEYTVCYKKTHSQTLLPMLDEIIEMTETDLKQIDAIAVSAGPGSFTGLRIGSATAKGLGLALDIPIIPVPTVDALAYNLFGTSAVVCPIMDAKREQVYTGIYEFQDGKFIVLEQQNAVSLEELMLRLNKRGRETIFLGDGVAVYKDRIKQSLTVPFYFAPGHLSGQRACAVAVLGAAYFEEGKTESAKKHVPVYIRMSQAERELARKKKEKAVE